MPAMFEPSEATPAPALNVLRQAFAWLFHRSNGAANHVLSRWIFLRSLGLIYFSAFFALAFQIHGLIGPSGILPTGEYLRRVHDAFPGLLHYWYAPTLLWCSSGNGALTAFCWTGMAASLLLVANLWPRCMLAVCWICFLSFVAGAGVFSGYQSDDMLLEAGFLAWFLAPRGVRPGLGQCSLPTHAALLLLLFEWFRIYFESGIVKLISGDPTWRNLTAMYEYYQNGPLPTWIGWYLQHWPNWFHLATAALTLVMELGFVFLAFLPGRFRVACFAMVTVWQAGVILTANYCFLNYLVLALGFLLLDDRVLRRFLPRPKAVPAVRQVPGGAEQFATAAALAWVFYAALAPLLEMAAGQPVLPPWPTEVIASLRIANRYGLFATMTPHRYEIEFQGSNDGQTWTAYPFRYKPQDPAKRPRIYAPYQPRFDWNLWFASLGIWEDNTLVLRTQERLLQGSRDVLGLFASDPFQGHPPRLIRAVLWQYWFSTVQEKKLQNLWWRRQLLGTYAPTLERSADGRIAMAAPSSLP